MINSGLSDKTERVIVAWQQFLNFLNFKIEAKI